MKTLQQILTISVAVTLSIFMVIGIMELGRGIMHAQDRVNIAKCIGWGNELQTNPDFYLADWQLQMCQYYTD